MTETATWRDVLRSRVTFDLTREPEDVAITGNVMASGDDAADRAAEDDVRAQLAAGNRWAWCTVVVTCRLPGTELTGTDTLGCCSYASREDFMQLGGYFEDMQGAAFDALCAQVEPIATALGLA
jgi:hypothetical protein